MKFKKCEMLKKGDKVAVVAPSAGICKICPYVYRNGINVLKSLGLKVIEYPTTKKLYKYNHDHPEFRANDINNAFKDKSIKGIISAIGGSDCNRILPYLDKETIRKNPKLFMGYSDTTTLNCYFNQLGLVAFNGPSVMAGFSQAKSMNPKFLDHIKDILFNNNSNYDYFEYPKYSQGYPKWGIEENASKINKLNKNTGWEFLQGKGVFKGTFYGGNIEVMEFIKSTKYYPKLDFFKNKILIFETSEDKPSITNIKYMLRNYGLQGVYDKISGVIFGRCRDYSKKEKEEFNKMVLEIIRDEFDNKTIPIITNFDFGHTDPQLIMPLGIKAEINCSKKTVKLIENMFVDKKEYFSLLV